MMLTLVSKYVLVQNTQSEAIPGIDLGLENTSTIAESGERDLVKVLGRCNSITQKNKTQIRQKEEMDILQGHPSIKLCRQ